MNSSWAENVTRKVSAILYYSIMLITTKIMEITCLSSQVVLGEMVLQRIT
jgi:hypothetical protein